MARIHNRKLGKLEYLGLFDILQAAERAYDQRARKLEMELGLLDEASLKGVRRMSDRNAIRQASW